jgi:hypothetical protein
MSPESQAVKWERLIGTGTVAAVAFESGWWRSGTMRTVTGTGYFRLY